MYKFYYTKGYGVTSYIRKAITGLWLIAWNPNIRKWPMRINLTCLMLLIAFMQVSLAASAQKISLSKKNAPLTEIFKELRKQSGYDFVINKDQIKIAKPVTIMVNGDDLINVLNKCFDGQPFTYSMQDKMIIVVNRSPEQVKANALPIDVKGRLIDENGVALESASVIIKGTERKTITNDKGEFSFTNVDEGAIIIISYIGYETKEIFAKVDLGIIKISTSTGKLDEVSVVSTGYQTLPKERATGSFTSIDNRLLNKQVSTDILSRLEAISSGLVIDRSSGINSRIIIRGLSTIRGPREPLIILDNFPYEGDFNNINPNDIENITILKDGAASSIWGARAGNGVIVITSKKSKFNSPININVNLNTSLADRPSLGKLRLISSTDYINNEIFLFGKGIYNADINSASKPVLTPVVELLLAKTNGLISSQDTESQLNMLRNFDVRDQFLRYKYRPSLKTQGSVSLSGGSERYAWTSFVGYDMNQSDLDARYKRLSTRFQSTYKPLKNMELEGGISFSRSINNSGKQGLGSISYKTNVLYPYAQFADENGNALTLDKDYRLSYLRSLANGKLQDWAYYPLTDDSHVTTAQNTMDFLINAAIKYKLPYYFSVDLKYLYENQPSTSEILYDKDSYFARYSVNRLTQFANNSVIYRIPKGGILDFNRDVLEVHNLRGQLNFNNNNGAHELNAFVGAERRESLRKGNSSRLYGFNDELLTFGIVDYTTQFPNIINGNSEFIQDRNSISSINTRFFSVFGNAAYSYRSKYTFSISGRRDGSNLFGVNINNRWNPLWSTGLSWDISKEKSYKIKWMPKLKMRLTYGVSGNVDPSMTGVTTLFYTGNATYIPEPSARFSSYSNPELQWENSAMFNSAIEFVLLDGRVSGSVEYYHKKGDKLFGVSLLDYTGGVGASIVKNVANMSGKGYEFQINSMNTTGKFKWSTNFNLSFYNDKITKYYLVNFNGNSFIGPAGSYPISGMVGKPVYSVFAYKSTGIDPVTGDPRGEINGEISKNYTSLVGAGTQLKDLKYFGSAVPTAFGNLGNNFTYKNFELNIQLSFKAGYYFRRNSINYGELFAGATSHKDFELRWQKPGDEESTYVPSLIYPAVPNRDLFYKSSEVLVSRGDHLRLQYINLSYSPKIKFESLKSITLFANLSNLGVLWTKNKQHIDPDYEVGLNSLSPSKTISFGLRTSF